MTNCLKTALSAMVATGRGYRKILLPRGNVSVTSDIKKSIIHLVIHHYSLFFASYYLRIGQSLIIAHTLRQ